MSTNLFILFHTDVTKTFYQTRFYAQFATVSLNITTLNLYSFRVFSCVSAANLS